MKIYIYIYDVYGVVGRRKKSNRRDVDEGENVRITDHNSGTVSARWARV